MKLRKMNGKDLKKGDLVTGPEPGIWRVDAIPWDCSVFEIILDKDLQFWRLHEVKRITLETFFDQRKQILDKLNLIEQELRKQAMDELVRLSEEMGLYDQT